MVMYNANRTTLSSGEMYLLSLSEQNKNRLEGKNLLPFNKAYLDTAVPTRASHSVAKLQRKYVVIQKVFGDNLVL